MDSDLENDDLCVKDGSVFFAQYLLYSQRKKNGCLKDADIKKGLSSIPSGKKKVCTERAIRHLKRFGIKVVVEETPSGYRHFYVGSELQMNPNVLDDEENDYLAEEKAKYGLLLSILMMMQMLGAGSLNNGISEETLWNYLGKVGVVNGGCFGGKAGLQRLVGASPNAEFISQGWLSYKKSTDESGKDFVRYYWGRRAEQFIDPVATLSIFCENDGSKPDEWKAHYTAAVAAKRQAS